MSFPFAALIFTQLTLPSPYAGTEATPLHRQAPQNKKTDSAKHAGNLPEWMYSQQNLPVDYAIASIASGDTMSDQTIRMLLFKHKMVAAIHGGGAGTGVSYVVNKSQADKVLGVFQEANGSYWLSADMMEKQYLETRNREYMINQNFDAITESNLPTSIPTELRKAVLDIVTRPKLKYWLEIHPLLISVGWYERFYLSYDKSTHKEVIRRGMQCRMLMTNPDAYNPRQFSNWFQLTKEQGLILGGGLYEISAPVRDRAGR